MMPEDWKTQIGGMRPCFGAVGWPEKIRIMAFLWGSLRFRREFDQYVNLRPVACFPACRRPWPTVRRATSISVQATRRIFIDRGRMFSGTEREVVIQETVMSRVG